MELYAAVLIISGIAGQAAGDSAPSSKYISNRPAAQERAAIEAPAPAPKFEVEWSQGEPFVGATDGSSTATHGFQKLDGARTTTAMLPPSSGLSLVTADRGEAGYRLRFDEARSRYFVKLFCAEGRVLRIFVVYPEQAEIAIPHAKTIPFAKLPAGPIYLSVHNEAGHPLQNFKLAFPTDSADATDTTDTTDTPASMARNGI